MITSQSVEILSIKLLISLDDIMMSGPLCKMKSQEPGYEASFIPCMRTLPQGHTTATAHSPLSSSNPENAALSV